MRLRACLGAFLYLLLPTASAVTNTATVHMYCLSIRVEPGIARQFGLDYTLTFSSAHFNPPNHEFFPIFEDDLSHATLFVLEGPLFPEPLTGELVVLAPEELDDNTNGVPDFYEVEAAIPTARGEGFWRTDIASGDADITWTRAAGEHRGTFTVQLTSTEFGMLSEFSHNFEIIEYEGPFTYEPGDGPVTGQVELQRAGVDTARLTGPLVLTRVPTNRLSQFTIGESTLTNEVGQLVPVSLGDVERDPDYAMDYFGAIAFLNGDPATPELDYELFFIGFEDPNDADADGIPDLTDDTRPPPPPPHIAIARSGTDFQLSISGEAGVTYTLERASALDLDLWTEDQEVTLVETNHVLTLPASAAASRFWRLRWP